jgi:hypothetical protein
MNPAEAKEPVSIVWHSDLLAYSPKPEIAARGIFRAASSSRRGAQCVSCGTVVKRRGMKDANITIWTIETEDDRCTVLTCSPLCTERAQRRGICLDVTDQ